jgi:S-adenosylmethionine:tRNA ribosyltransferase-isomerase
VPSLTPLASDLFDFTLPPHLIAQHPVVPRDRSRLLVVHRESHRVEHRTFVDLPQYLNSGDTLFRNNAAVLPARLHAVRATGGHVECFLLRRADDDQTWHCLVRPGRKLPVGTRFSHPGGEFTGEIVNREPDGSALVRFTTCDGRPITAIANQIGDVPLPPYIDREDTASAEHDAQRALDLQHYQTVYADRARQVAVAAPTAGLHFTPELISTLNAAGVRTADITLHVGLGTFKPITTDTVEAHAMHREVYEIPAATQRQLFPPLRGRRIAVGTTSVRTIEDFLATHSAPLDGERDYIADTEIFVYPPRTFRGVDALLTNFHQPRSTLLCLVAAFLAPGSTEGVSWLREIYADAIAREYRFFSFGDAMLIL